MITKPVAGIPIPSKHSKYPFHAMVVGDSFMVKLPKDASSFMRKSFQSTIMRSAWKIRDSGKRFTTRQVAGGIRCWRVS